MLGHDQVGVVARHFRMVAALHASQGCLDFRFHVGRAADLELMMSMKSRKLERSRRSVNPRNLALPG